MRSIFDILQKNFQEDQLNSRRFPGFPGGFLNSSRFPGFPGVVDTLNILFLAIYCYLQIQAATNIETNRLYHEDYNCEHKRQKMLSNITIYLPKEIHHHSYILLGIIRKGFLQQGEEG